MHRWRALTVCSTLSWAGADGGVGTYDVVPRLGLSGLTRVDSGGIAAKLGRTLIRCAVFIWVSVDKIAHVSPVLTPVRAGWTMLAKALEKVESGCIASCARRASLLTPPYAAQCDQRHIMALVGELARRGEELSCVTWAWARTSHKPPDVVVGSNSPCLSVGPAPAAVPRPVLLLPLLLHLLLLLLLPWRGPACA
jgi:hypothetical protein